MKTECGSSAEAWDTFFLQRGPSFFSFFSPQAANLPQSLARNKTQLKGHRDKFKDAAWENCLFSTKKAGCKLRQVV